MKSVNMLRRAAVLAKLPMRQAREQREAEQAVGLLALKAAGTVPADCGPDYPVAPARGAYRTFVPTQVRPGSSGALEHAGYRGPGEAAFRKAIAVADIWDALEQPSRRRHEAEVAALADGARHPRWRPPFRSDQVAVGRRYRELTEAVAAAGIRGCLSSMLSSGSVQESVSEAVLDVVAELAGLHRRIGSGLAVSPAGGRQGIAARWLIDAVALDGLQLSSVLRARGWPANGRQREALRLALAEILDRMLGMRTTR